MSAVVKSVLPTAVDGERVRRYWQGSAADRARMRRNAWSVALSAVNGRSWRERGRSIHWSALQRGDRRFVMATGRESYIVRVGDEHIGRTVYRTGEYEFHKVTRALDALGVACVETVLDVGANIGTVCIPLVSRGLASRAIAIEPEPTNFALLTANVRLNGLLSSVTCLQAAAGSSGDATVELELARGNFGDHRVASWRGPRPDRSSSITARVVALDDVEPRLAGEKGLIWMDVQGFELQALRGASGLVDRGVPVVMEFWPAALAEHQSWQEIRELLECWSTVVDLGSRSLDPLSPAELDRLLSAHSRGGTQTDLLVRR